MKKLINFTLSALCLLASAIVLSCSDDDDPVFRVDNEVTKGIKADVFDNLYTFNLESSGEWTAGLPENCDWARVMQRKGVGSSKIEILVDGNNTGIDRKTVINIASGNQNIKVPLEQTASVGGDAPDNDDEFLILAGKKYLGYGCNLMEYMDAPDKEKLQYTSSNIMNVKAIDKLMENDDLGVYSSLANTNELELTDYEDARLDTVIQKEDKLGISLSINIAYGLMKFGIEGKYEGNETVGSNYLEIHTAANYPVLEASLNYPEIITHYEAWQNDDNAKDNDLRRGILSLSFVKAMDKLKKHCAENNEDAQRSDIKAIIANYGTGVITHSTLGGMIALDLIVDSMFIKEKYNLNDARLKFDLRAGALSIDTKIIVNYLNEATEIFQNSRHKVKILGGNRMKAGAINNIFEHSKYGTELSESISDWAYSIGYDSRTAQLIRFEAVPIWYLFQDAASQEAIIKYFKEVYPDSKFVQKYIGESNQQKK